MNQTDSSETFLAAAREEIDQLRKELSASQKHIARLLEMFEEQQRQVTYLQGALVRLERIFRGRIWRTLRTMAVVAKKFIPAKGTPSGASRTQVECKNTHLVCDEPRPDESRPRCGRITVRGWTPVESGVDCVQVEVAGLPILETKPSTASLDLPESLPDLNHSERMTFALQFDSQKLTNGRHPILVRALAKGSVIQETRTFVEIDQEKGFASDYQRWIHDFERPESQVIELKVSLFAVQPKISIVMPVYNTKREELEAALDSVLQQSYPHWELCICDDCSSEPRVRTVLDRYAEREPRIKVQYAAEHGGISRTSNAAWRMASGDYLALMDHDDTLAPHALAYVCEAINQNSHSDLFYSDEDKLDERGARFAPFFKPDWSPDLILSENYVCHLLVLRKDLADRLGGFNPALDGSQDYDLVLRASEQAARIQHIPRVLYHWRAGATSVASDIENKNYALETARRALEEYCERGKEGAKIERGVVAGRWRARYPVAPGTRVSIIVASGGKVDILRTNLDSLFEKTLYPDYEVVITDNSKSGSTVEKLINRYQVRHPNLRYIDWRNKPFNFSAINNAAARQCEAPLLLFLNDDTSVIEGGWLGAMVELAARPEVGAVGAKLLYPDGAIQHAGVVMGLFENCGHAFKGLNGAIRHYFDFPDVIRNVSAVTGACLMAKASVFWQVGGFDERQFPVAFNDVDLCLKIGRYGYRVLYTPHTVLYHHESHSKTFKDLLPRGEEVAGMQVKWDGVIQHDPYYSPNLTRVDEDYSLRSRT